MTYNLGSSGMVFAPGVIRAAIHAYRVSCDAKDRTWAMRLVHEGWGVPKPAAKALLSGSVPHTVEGDTVSFTV